MNFTYDPQLHTYYLDDQMVPGVTDLLDPLSDYSNVPEFMLQQAADRGTAVHAACADWVNGHHTQGLTSEIAAYWGAFRKWWAEQGFDMCAGIQPVSERPLLHSKLKYAGTPDIIFDGIAVIDIKTRKYNKKTDPLQLAAYENLWTANGGRRCEYKHYVLELHNDETYKLVTANNRQAWSKFRFLLDHHWRCREYEQNIIKWRKSA